MYAEIKWTYNIYIFMFIVTMNNEHCLNLFFFVFPLILMKSAIDSQCSSFFICKTMVIVYFKLKRKLYQQKKWNKKKTNCYGTMHIAHVYELKKYNCAF